MKIISSEFVKSSGVYLECPATTSPEYAFIGRSNVGKSSLINMLTSRKNLAKTSNTPGKTKVINHFIINNEWYMVDLPGYGYAKVSKLQRKSFGKMIEDYLLQRTNMVCVFVLIDCRHAPLKNDVEFIEWLGLNEIPFVIVFTKADKLSSSALNKNLKMYKAELMKKWDELPKIIITSSETGLGRMEILNLIDSVNEKID